MSSENHNSEMKVFYYYVRDNWKAPIITVCLANYEDVWYRGVALCSVMDNPCKIDGRAWAFDRALKAIYSQRDQLPIKSSLVFDYLQTLELSEEDRTGLLAMIMKERFSGNFYKSSKDPYLTDFEIKLITPKSES